MGDFDNVIVEEVTSDVFSCERFAGCVSKFGLRSSLTKAYLEETPSIISGEITTVREKEVPGVLKIDIQEEASEDGQPGKLFGLFAFKQAVPAILNLKLKPGDLIAFQGAIIEESLCYYIPPNCHKIHARISDPPLQTKVWFMRKSVSQSVGKAEYRTIPKYLYQKLSAITVPSLSVFIYGIVVSLKESTRGNGKLMVRVGLVDDTGYSVDHPFDLYIYGSNREVAAQIQKFQVLRAHRVKVEKFNGRLDGRVFRCADIATVDSDVVNGNRDSVHSAAKTFDWTESDKARVLELYSWMWAQPWYRNMSNEGVLQNLIEDIKEPGLIKLYCEIVAIRKSKDDECCVLTVTDGTICKLHIKKINDVENKQSTDIQNENTCFQSNQLEVDVIVTHLTDEFKLLEVGYFVYLTGVEVTNVPSKSTDTRLLLSLTVNARRGSLRTFEPRHSVAKRIRRKLSLPKVLLNERMERLESDRDIISLQDISNSSVNQSGQSIVLDPVRPSPSQITSPSKKRSIENENELQGQFDLANKKIKPVTGDSKKDNSETLPYFSNVDRNCRRSVSPCAAKKDKRTVNENGAETSEVSCTGMNPPVLSFSIINGDKALQSLRRKIVENSGSKNETQNPDRVIAENNLARSPRQEGGTGTEWGDKFFDSLEKDLEAIFGDTNEFAAVKENNDGNVSRLPEKNSKTPSVPLSNNVIPSSSEGFSSVGTYSQFCSKITKAEHVTSTQQENAFQSGKHVGKLQVILQGEREATVEDIQQTSGEKEKKQSKSKLQCPVGTKCNCNARSTAVDAPYNEQSKCLQIRKESQSQFSTFNSHPHYCIDSVHPVADVNTSTAIVRVNKANMVQKSTTVKPALEECRQHSQSISHNVVQADKGTACASILLSNSGSSIVNEVRSDMQEAAESDKRNSQQPCQASITECVQIAETTKSSDHREAIETNCQIITVQAKSGDQEDSSQQLQATPQVGNSVGANDTRRQESSPVKSPLSLFQARSSATKSSLVTEDSEIPCAQVHYQSSADLSGNIINDVNSQGCGLIVHTDQAQQTHTNSGFSLQKPMSTDVCIAQNTVKSCEQGHRGEDKEKQCESRLCLGVLQQRGSSIRRDCAAVDMCSLCFGISTHFKSLVISGWIINIEPSVSDLKDDLVSGYCPACNRIKRYSRVKTFVLQQGKWLCSHCHSKGHKNELTLMFFFTMQVAIKSGSVFNIMIGHRAFSELFDFTIEDYIFDIRTQSLARNFLNKMIVKENERRTTKNRLECVVLYDFQDNTYSAKHFLYIPCCFLKFTGRF